MCVVLLYGLYVDTSSFCKLYREKDMEMRRPFRDITSILKS